MLPESRSGEILVGGSGSAFPLPFSGVVTKAAGSRVWDDAGREYVDFIMGSGPLILGHGNPRVVEAVREQAGKGTTYYMPNGPANELALRIVEIPGAAELVRFASTGTEAVLHAIRIARAYTKRDKVLLFEGSYHGSHDAALVAMQAGRSETPAGVPAAAAHDVVLARFNDLETLEAAFERDPSGIAAVVVEPQQRSIDPAPGFLQALAQIAKSNRCLLIFDEVMTGFRLAYGGAQEFYGIYPDIVCYGKILGGGLPISAIAGRREVMGLVDPRLYGSSRFVHVSGTLSGNPLSAVAGLATLAELREAGIYDRLHALGRNLRTVLQQALEQTGVKGAITGNGPIAAVELWAQQGCSGERLSATVNRELIARGVLVQLKTRFYLSTAHTQDDVAFAAEVFEDALRMAVSEQAR